jgi:hypothetical protein
MVVGVSPTLGLYKATHSKRRSAGGALEILLRRSDAVRPVKALAAGKMKEKTWSVVSADGSVSESLDT